MKPARREISIFNISTIDLFASALGAFMIVSFVLLPYFPNTGNGPSSTIAASPVPEPPPAPEPTPGISLDEHEALREQLAEAEAERVALNNRLEQTTIQRDALDNRLQEVEEERNALGVQLTSAEESLNVAIGRGQESEQSLTDAASTLQRLPAIDLVIALDTTSSMTNEVASLREEIAGLSELLLHLTEDAAVGIIDFKDRCDPNTALRVAPLRRIDAVSVTQLSAFARSMEAGSSPCNLSADEDYAEALRSAVNANWRPGTEQRTIVMISDNPAHADLHGQALLDARSFSRRPGARHTVSAVFVDTSAPGLSDPNTVPFMRSVADAGGGEFVRANEDASLSVTILRAIFND